MKGGAASQRAASARGFRDLTCRAWRWNLHEQVVSNGARILRRGVRTRVAGRTLTRRESSLLKMYTARVEAYANLSPLVETTCVGSGEGGRVGSISASARVPTT